MIFNTFIHLLYDHQFTFKIEMHTFNTLSNFKDTVELNYSTAKLSSFQYQFQLIYTILTNTHLISKFTLLHLIFYYHKKLCIAK